MKIIIAALALTILGSQSSFAGILRPTCEVKELTEGSNEMLVQTTGPFVPALVELSRALHFHRNLENGYMFTVYGLKEFEISKNKNGLSFTLYLRKDNGAYGSSEVVVDSDDVVTRTFSADGKTRLELVCGFMN